MKTVIDLFLKYLPQLVQAGKSIPDITKYVGELKETLKQDAEWTPQIEADFLAKVENVTSAPHWKPEGQ